MDNQFNIQPKTQTSPMQQEPLPQTQPLAPEKPKKSVGSIISIIILSVLLVGALGGDGFLYMQWQSAKDDLTPVQNQLTEEQKKTQDQQKQIDEQNAQLKAARDTQRKKDIALFARVLNDYKAKNGDYLTTEGSESEKIYQEQLSKVVEDFNDPSTEKTYGFIAVAQVQTPPVLEVGIIQYQWLGKCGSDGDFVDTNSENDAAIRTVLENGTTFCRNL